MKKSLSYIAFIAIISFCVVSCGSDEDRCFTCTLNSTVVDVCESNYQELAARNNLEVSSLDQYISLIRPTGFSCIEID